MTSVTFLIEILKFSFIGTQLGLKKQIFNGDFLYMAIFSKQIYYEDVI